MTDLEFFGGFDSSDKIDPASFEKFKERVKAASAQIKALKIAEQKKRKQEDKLVQILLKFVKNHQKKDIMLLIAKLLEENFPPLFILSIVALGNEEIRKQLEGGVEGEKISVNQGLLKEPRNKGVSDEKEKSSNQDLLKGASVFFEEQKVLPLKLKIQIDAWMKDIHEEALKEADRVVQKAFDAEDNIKLPLIQLCTFVLRDFLEENQQEADYEKLKEFSDFFLNAVIRDLKKNLETQKRLEE
jgi:hypothetical protein